MRGAEQFTIGRVFGLLPKALGQESISLWLGFAGFALVLNLLQYALLHGPNAESLGSGLMAGAFSLAVFVALCFVQCAAVYAAAMRLDGAPVQAVDALRVGFSRFWAYLGLSILLGIIVGLGLMLVILPGLFAWSAFSLALPILVVRRVGVFDSIGISGRMTKGHRLKILGFWFVYGIASFLVVALFILLGVGVIYITGLAGTVGQELPAIVLNAVFSGLSFVVAGSTSAIIFRLIEAEAAGAPA